MRKAIFVTILWLCSFSAVRVWACDEYPIAVIDASADYALGGEPITLDGRYSVDPDADGYITTYQWQFGDGTGQAGPVVTHTFAVESGCSYSQYTVTLTVTDNSGYTDTTTWLCFVRNSGALTLQVPSDRPTIQGAIDVSRDGDTIVVAEGIYYENIDFRGREITVTGTDPQDWAVVQNTVIDAGGAGTAVRFEGSEEFCQLTGVTVRGGDNAEGLIGCWEFNDNDASSNVACIGRRGYAGRLHDDSDADEDYTSDHCTPGRVGTCFNFDGVDDYVELDGGASGTMYRGPGGGSPRTVSTWINLAADISSVANIATWGYQDGDDLGRSWMFRIDANRLLDVGIYGGSITGSTILNPGQWYHVAAALEDVDRDGVMTTRDIKLYVNGQLENSTFAGDDLPINTDAGQGKGMIIGARAVYAPDETATVNGWFRGLIDDVRIYGRALTADEIGDLAEVADPTSHWTFDADGNDSEGANTATFCSGAFVDPVVKQIGGGALCLDGTDDYGRVDGYTGILGDHARTCCAWIKTTLAGDVLCWGNNQAVGDKWRIHIGGVDNVLSIQAGGGCYRYGMTPLGDDAWHHIAVVFQGKTDGLNGDITEVRLYVDGREDGVSSMANGIINTVGADDVEIGAYTRGGTVYFNGHIDDVRVYDRALTVSEIIGIAEDGGILAYHYWKLDDGSGSTAQDCDASNTTFDGTVAGDMQWATGRIGGALAFDGDTSDCVTVAAHPDLDVQDEFTVAAWVCPDLDIATNGRIILRVDSLSNDAFFLTYHLDGWTFQVTDDGSSVRITSDSLCAKGVWTHVLAKREPGGVLKLYVNGIQQAQTASCSGSLTGGDLFIGNNHTGDFPFKGRIDDVRFYHWALSDEEIYMIAGGKGLVAHWKLDETDTSQEGASEEVAGYMGVFSATGSLPQPATGMLDGATEFDGSQGQHIEVNTFHGVTGDQPRTCCAWIKTGENQGGDVLSWGNNIDAGAKWRMQIGGTDQVLSIQVGSGSRFGSTPLDDGRWHHVAVVFRGQWGSLDGDVDEMLLYVDGREEYCSMTVSCLINTSADVNVDIGGYTYAGAGVFHFTGLIDDVRIYNVAMSAIEIRRQYTGAYGGGIDGNGTAATISDCLITDNYSVRDGAGIHNILGQISGCRIFNNTSLLNGGGIYCQGGNTQIADCKISGNYAQNGGGVYFGVGSAATILDCELNGNVSTQAPIRAGGGAIACYSSNTTIVGCDIHHNSAINNDGGGIHILDSSPTVERCLIRDNDAVTKDEGRGGGIWIGDDAGEAEPTFISCVISNNWAVDGGGVRVYGGGPSFVGCTFAGNSASHFGGAIDFDQPSDANCIATMANCIIWGNLAVTAGTNIYKRAGAGVTYAYCDVQSSGGSAAWGETFGTDGGNNVDVDPLFEIAGGYHLQAISPCLNSGDNGAFAADAKDIDGGPRIVGGVADKGADEYDKIWVDDDAVNDPGPGDPSVSDPHEDGTDEHPFDTIQEGINAAVNGCVVIVRPGTYSGVDAADSERRNRDMSFVDQATQANKALTVQSVDPTDPAMVAASIVDCGGSEVEPHRGFTFGPGAGPDSVLDGLTIINGYGPDVEWDGVPRSTAGGIFCDDASPTIRNCVLRNNRSSCWGGAFYSKYGDPQLINCTFENNWSVNSTEGGTGAGIYMIRAEGLTRNAIIQNCVFSNNETAGAGAGIYLENSHVLVSNCTFIQNVAAGSGGGLATNNDINHSDPIYDVVSCRFYGNRSLGVGKGGGALWGLDSQLTLANCEFVGNTALEYGGGVYLSKLDSGVSPATFVNCTLANNEGAIGGGIFCLGASLTMMNSVLWGNVDADPVGTILSAQINGDTSGVTYSCVQDACPIGASELTGVGNIDENPLFARKPSPGPDFAWGTPDDDYGDLHLFNSCSPCIDAGNNAALPMDSADLDDDSDTAEPLPFDLDGNARVVNDPLKLPDAATVDMGAYEFADMTGIDQPPYAADDPGVCDPLIVCNGTPITIDVLANDCDPEGAGLLVYSVTQPTSGQLTNNDGADVTYTPELGFSGIVTFTYDATDGQHVSNTAVVTVEVCSDFTVHVSPSKKTLHLPTIDTVSLVATVEGVVEVASVEWSYTALYGGGSVSFSPADQLITDVTFGGGGTYLARVTVTSTLGISVSQAAWIEVVGPPEDQLPPAVTAWVDGYDPTVVPEITLPTNTVDLVGSITDDGRPYKLQAEWSVADGPYLAQVDFGSYTADAPSTTATFHEPGAYTLKLWAYDGLAEAHALVRVVVAPPAVVNGAPTAELGPDRLYTRSAMEPFTVQLDDAAFGDASPTGTLTRTWSWSGPAAGMLFSKAVQTDPLDTTPQSITFFELGTYIVILTVSDGEYTSSDSMTVAIKENEDVTVADGIQVYAGQDKQITLPVDSVSLSDAAVTDLATGEPYTAGMNVNWLLASGPGTVMFVPDDDHPTCPELCPTATFSKAGEYTLRLEVTDNCNGRLLEACDDLIVRVNPGTRISAGENHSMVICADDMVWVCGDNSSGQLGIGLSGSEPPYRAVLTPVHVGHEGFTSEAKFVAGGLSHSLALDPAGSVWAWGGNASGQLGNDTIAPSPTPIKVHKCEQAGSTNYLENIVAIASGRSGAHSLAVGSDGVAWSWGRNVYKELGRTVTANSNRVPCAVMMEPHIYWPVDMDADVTYIDDKTGKCHGNVVTDESFGQVVNGDGVTGNCGYSLSFNGGDQVDIDGSQGGGVAYYGILGKQSRTISFWVKVVTVADCGKAISWGNPSVDGGAWEIHVEGDRHVSVRVGGDDGGIPYATTSSGMITENAWNHVAVVMKNDGSPDISEVKIYIGGEDVTASPTITCPINTQAGSPLRIGDAYEFFGSLDEIRIYERALTNAEIETLHSDVGADVLLSNIISVAAGAYHSLALERLEASDPESRGRVYAWGINYTIGNHGTESDAGQLGDGTFHSREAAVTMITPDWNYNGLNNDGGYLENIIAISAGWSISAMLEKFDPADENCQGRVFMCGTTKGGGWTELCYGNTPVPILSGAQNIDGNEHLEHIVAVAAGERHCIALDNEGHVWAWGSNNLDSLIGGGPIPSGQLGDGTYDDTQVPVQVVGPDLDNDGQPDGFLGDHCPGGIVAIAAGYWHSLALDAEGVVWSWGLGDAGRLGIGHNANRNFPQRMLFANRVTRYDSSYTEQGTYNRISEAVEDAEDGDTIVAQPGFYDENIDFGNRSITVRSIDPQDRSVVKNTVIDGSGSNVVTFGTDSGDTTVDTVVNATLAGFTIRNGLYGVHVPGASGYAASPGSLYLKLNIEQNIITDNAESGVSFPEGQPTNVKVDVKISNCEITRNVKNGISFYSDNAVHHARIANNRIADNSECGIALSSASLALCRIVSNKIIDNTQQGVFIISTDGDVFLDNNWICENGLKDSGSGGHGIYLDSGSGQRVISCNTVANNRAYGVYVQSGSPVGVHNCILWANGTTNIHGDAATANYSCIEGGFEGEDNINNINPSEGPMFVNAPTRDVTTSTGTFNTICVADIGRYTPPCVIELNNDGVLRNVQDNPAPSGNTVTFAPAADQPISSGVKVFIWGSGVTNLEADYHLLPGSLCINAGFKDAATSVTDSTVTVASADADQLYEPGHVIEIGWDGVPRVITGPLAGNTITFAPALESIPSTLPTVMNWVAAACFEDVTTAAGATTYEIVVDDASRYTINDAIQIDSAYARITDLDSANGKVYFLPPLGSTVPAGTSVKNWSLAGLSDIDGGPRIMGGHVDMGADERAKYVEVRAGEDKLLTMLNPAVKLDDAVVTSLDSKSNPDGISAMWSVLEVPEGAAVTDVVFDPPLDLGDGTFDSTRSPVLRPEVYFRRIGDYVLGLEVSDENGYYQGWDYVVIQVAAGVDAGGPYETTMAFDDVTGQPIAYLADGNILSGRIVGVDLADVDIIWHSPGDNLIIDTPVNTQTGEDIITQATATITRPLRYQIALEVRDKLRGVKIGYAETWVNAVAPDLPPGADTSSQLQLSVGEPAVRTVYLTGTQVSVPLEGFVTGGTPYCVRWVHDSEVAGFDGFDESGTLVPTTETLITRAVFSDYNGYALSLLAENEQGETIASRSVWIEVLPVQTTVQAAVLNNGSATIQWPNCVVNLDGTVRGDQPYRTRWVYDDSTLVTFGNELDLDTWVKFNSPPPLSTAEVYKIWLLAEDALGNTLAVSDIDITVLPGGQVTDTQSAPGEVVIDASSDGAGGSYTLEWPNNIVALHATVKQGQVDTLEWSIDDRYDVIAFVGPDVGPSTIVSFSNWGRFEITVVGKDSEGHPVGYGVSVVEISLPGAGGGSPASVVNAGEDQTVTLIRGTAQANLHGTIDNPLFSPVWRMPQAAEQIANIIPASSTVEGGVLFTDAVATFSEIGTYGIKLEASDNLGNLMGGDIVSITVQSAIVGIHTPQEQAISLASSLTTTLTGTVDGDIAEVDFYEWRQTGGPRQATIDPVHPGLVDGSVSSTVTFPADGEGTYKFQLAAVNAAQECIGESTIMVKAAPANRAPQVNVGTYPPVDFDQSHHIVLSSEQTWCSDDGGDQDLVIEWTCLDSHGLPEPAVDTSSPYSSMHPKVTVSAPETYVMRVTVKDKNGAADGLSAAATVTLHFYSSNGLAIGEEPVLNPGQYGPVVKPAESIVLEDVLYVPSSRCTQYSILWTARRGPVGSTVGFASGDPEQPVLTTSGFLRPQVYFCGPNRDPENEEPVVGTYTLRITVTEDGDGGYHAQYYQDVIIEVTDDPSGDVVWPLITKFSAISEDHSTNDRQDVYGQIAVVIEAEDDCMVVDNDPGSSANAIWLNLDGIDRAVSLQTMVIEVDERDNPQKIRAEGILYTHQLSLGSHTLTAKVTDADGHSTERSIGFSVVAQSGIGSTGGSSGSGGVQMLPPPAAKPVAEITNLAKNSLDTKPVNAQPLTTATERTFTLAGKAFGFDRDAQIFSEVQYKVDLYMPDAGAYVAKDWFLLDGSDTRHPKYFVKNVLPGTKDGYVSGMIEDNALGELDLSGVANGTYRVLLTVRTGGGLNAYEYAYAQGQLVVDCPLKIGQVKFSQEDVVIPVGGIPLRVVRTYDSLRKDADGDFGYGWTYSIADMDIQLDERRTTLNPYPELGYSSHSVRIGSNYDRNVTLTLPDGNRATFVFGLKLKQEWYATYYVAVYDSPPGVDATLETWPEERMLGTGVWDGQGEALLGFQDSANHDFEGYRLTLADGTQCFFTRTDPPVNGDIVDYGDAPYYVKPRGPLYLTSIVTAQNEKIEFNVDLYTGRIGQDEDDLGEPKGIQHFDTADQMTKALHIVYRPEDGRIGEIYAPMEQTAAGDLPPEGDARIPTVYYGYDSAGNLTDVHKLVKKASSRSASNYETITYAYDGDNYDSDGRYTHTYTPADHFITDITDPRGVKPIRYLYDDSGRLIATIDAKGRKIVLQHGDPDSAFGGEFTDDNLEIIYERSDTEKDHPTVYQYDNRGNVVKIVKYIAPGETLQPYSTTVHTYSGDADHPDDLVKTEVTTPTGAAVTHYFTAYDEAGKVREQTTVDPEGNVTQTQFDTKGNTLSTVQGKNAVIQDEFLTGFVEVARTENTYYYSRSGDIYSEQQPSGAWMPANLLKSTAIVTNYEDPLNPGPSENNEEQVTQYNYDARGRLKYVRNLATAGPDVVIKYNYDAAAGSPEQPYSVSEPCYDADDDNDNNVWQYTQYSHYDKNGNADATWHYWDNPVNGPGADKRILSITEYDAAGRATRVLRLEDTCTDPANPDIENTLDDLADNFEAYLVAGNVIVLSATDYDKDGFVASQRSTASVETMLDVQTESVYDESGQAVRTLTSQWTRVSTNPETYDYLPLTISETLYDADGRAIVTTDPISYASWMSNSLPNATETVYDQLGRAVETRRWANVQIFWDVLKNADNEQIGLKALDGLVAANSWDGQPEVGKVLAWTSNNRQPVKGDELSHTRTEYDVADRVYRTYTVTEDGFEMPTTFGYDAAGRQEKVTDALGHDLAADVWDVTGRLTSIGLLEPAQHQTLTEYDGIRRWKTTDAEGHVTEYSYDSAGRLVRTKHPEVDYVDAAGQPLTGPLYTHVMYDELGRKTYDFKPTRLAALPAETDPAFALHVQKEFDYDAAGRLAMVILASVDDPETPSEDLVHPVYRYYYDNFGNQIGILDPKGRATVFVYDHLQRMTRKYMPYSVSIANPDDLTDPTAIIAWDDIFDDLPASPVYEETEYDSLGRALKHTDYKGQVRYCYYYDAKTSLVGTEFTGPVGQLRCEDFYKAANAPATRPEDPDTVVPDSRIVHTYDILGRKDSQKVYNHENEAVVEVSSEDYAYDAFGNMTAITSLEGTVNYEYSVVTGAKTATWTGTEPLAPNTKTEYAYDELGRLASAMVTWRNCRQLDTPEETTYSYNDVGSRESVTLPNDVYTEYQYDALNRLRDLAHYRDFDKSLTVSSFVYEFYANGMRRKATESLRYPAGQADQNPVTVYEYDALNRLASESVASSYDASYTSDLVGNRTLRAVTATNSGVPLTTTYTYDPDHPDRLQSESHSGPVAAIPWHGDRVYACADGSGNITYWLPGRQRHIGQFRAVFMGLPSVWTGRLLTVVLACLPLAFFWPVIVQRFRRFRACANGPRPALSLYHRCLCVLLVYVFLIGPECLQTLAQAAVAYDQVSTLAWGKGGRTIVYGYDDNGSMTSKVTSEGGGAVESVTYTYNLQNRLESVTTDHHNSEVDHAEYAYNPSGIRVSAHTWTTVNDVPQDEQTVLYLVDPDNHTGYAQTLEETSYADDGAGGWTRVARMQYTIGDDVISQTRSTWVDGVWLAEDVNEDNVDDTEYLLYDGHGSTRQLVRHALLDLEPLPAGDGVGETPDVVDSYSYDGYGVMLSSGSGADAAASAGTSLLYTGEHYDSHASQYYLRARYYDPTNGRFNRVDPYAGNPQDPQSLHKYLYCHANPINNTDPTGLFTLPECLTVNSIMAIAIASLAPALISGYETAKANGSVWEILRNASVAYVLSFGLGLGLAIAGPYIMSAAVWALTLLPGVTPAAAATAIAITFVGLAIYGCYELWASDYPLWLKTTLTATIAASVVVAAGKQGIRQIVAKAKNVLKGFEGKSSAQQVTNPWGRPGSPAHRQGIDQVEMRLKNKGWDHIAGGSKPEQRVYLPDGTYKYPDLLFAKGGKNVAINVGRATGAGVPVAREARALAGLRQVGELAHAFFVRF